jgi:hypothetical protein
MPWYGVKCIVMDACKVIDWRHKKSRPMPWPATIFSAAVPASLSGRGTMEDGFA